MCEAGDVKEETGHKWDLSAPAFVPNRTMHLSRPSDVMLGLKVVLLRGDVIWSGEVKSGDWVVSLRTKVSQRTKRPSAAIKLLCGTQELKENQTFRAASVSDNAVVTAILLPAYEGEWDEDFADNHRQHGATCKPILASKDMFTCDICELDVPGSFRDVRDEVLYCKRCDFAICWWCRNFERRGCVFMEFDSD